MCLDVLLKQGLHTKQRIRQNACVFETVPSVTVNRMHRCAAVTCISKRHVLSVFRHASGPKIHSIIQLRTLRQFLYFDFIACVCRFKKNFGNREPIRWANSIWILRAVFDKSKGNSAWTIINETV